MTVVFSGGAWLADTPIPKPLILKVEIPSRFQSQYLNRNDIRKTLDFSIASCDGHVSGRESLHEAPRDLHQGQHFKAGHRQPASGARGGGKEVRLEGR